jgi:hypothetical protein
MPIDTDPPREILGLVNVEAQRWQCAGNALAGIAGTLPRSRGGAAHANVAVKSCSPPAISAHPAWPTRWRDREIAAALETSRGVSVCVGAAQHLRGASTAPTSRLRRQRHSRRKPIPGPDVCLPFLRDGHARPRQCRVCSCGRRSDTQPPNQPTISAACHSLPAPVRKCDAARLHPNVPDVTRGTSDWIKTCSAALEASRPLRLIRSRLRRSEAFISSWEMVPNRKES